MRKKREMKCPDFMKEMDKALRGIKNEISSRQHWLTEEIIKWGDEKMKENLTKVFQCASGLEQYYYNSVTLKSEQLQII